MNLKLSKILKSIFAVAIFASIVALFVWRLGMQGVTMSGHFTIKGSSYLLGILGVVMLAVVICVSMLCKRDGGLKYLIIADFMLATWIYLRSETISPLFIDCMPVRFIRLTMLTLIMIPVVLFFDEFQKFRYHKTNVTFLILPILDWAGCMIVYFLFGLYSDDIYMACQIITIMILFICLYHLSIDYIKLHIKVARQIFFALLLIFAGVAGKIFCVWSEGYEWIDVLFGYLAFLSFLAIFQCAVLSTVREYLQEQKMKRQTEANSVYRKLHEDARDYLLNIKKENHYILEQCMDEEMFRKASDLAWNRWRLANLLSNMEDCIAISNENENLLLECIDMGALNNYIIRNTIEEAERKNIELDIDIEENFPKAIWGIKHYAERMLFNLLLYAIETTEEGEKVTFQTGYLNVGNDMIKIITTVESSGSGMSKEEYKNIQHIFKNLSTIEIPDLEKMAFGLRIVAVFAKIMKSTMDIENELGKGTRIQIASVCRIADATPIGEFQDWYIVEESYYQKYRKRILKKKKEESLNQKLIEKQDAVKKHENLIQDGKEQDHKSILYAGNIHVDSALKYVGNDYQQYVQIMKLFSEKKQEKQKILEQYYIDKDYQNYTIQVHALKNNARMLGADKLADMAFEHEKAGTQKDEMYLDAHYEELLEEWNRVESVFSLFLNKEEGELSETNDNEIQQTISKEEWLEKINEMLECLELFQKKETLELLEELKQFSLSAEQLNIVNGTMDAVKKYDYDGAIEILKKDSME